MLINIIYNRSKYIFLSGLKLGMYIWIIKGIIYQRMQIISTVLLYRNRNILLIYKNRTQTQQSIRVIEFWHNFKLILFININTKMYFQSKVYITTILSMNIIK